jgi:lipid-A-disaccharide synthase
MLGAAVLAALRQRYPALVVEGVGGPLLAQQGLSSLFPMERLSVMGLFEPLARLPELLRIRRRVLAHFRAAPPDLFLGIDSPDFNLDLERALRARGVPTAHLVSPSVWAWRRGRIHGIKRSVDLMLCLFPFETAIYAEHGVPVSCVGHPLADSLPSNPDPAGARQALGIDPGARVLALLPGSRRGEVRRLAPVFLQAARVLQQADPGLTLLVPAAGDARLAELEAMVAARPELQVTLVAGRSREVLAACDAALLASGTATLEAALLGRPMVVAYRTGALNWWLLQRLVSTPFAALPNILAGRELVPELLQRRATPAALAAALGPLLAGAPAGAAQLQGFAGIRNSLCRGFAGRVADELVALLERPGRG